VREPRIGEMWKTNCIVKTPWFYIAHPDSLPYKTAMLEAESPFMIIAAKSNNFEHMSARYYQILSVHGISWMYDVLFNNDTQTAIIEKIL
jgi:hypothetical protein